MHAPGLAHDAAFSTSLGGDEEFSGGCISMARPNAVAAFEAEAAATAGAIGRFQTKANARAAALPS